MPFRGRREKKEEAVRRGAEGEGEEGRKGNYIGHKNLHPKRIRELLVHPAQKITRAGILQIPQNIYNVLRFWSFYGLLGFLVLYILPFFLLPFLFPPFILSFLPSLPSPLLLTPKTGQN
jgi:hypothetical protein